MDTVFLVAGSLIILAFGGEFFMNNLHSFDN